MPIVTYGEPKHACPDANYLMIGRSDPEFRTCRCPKHQLEAQAQAQTAVLRSLMRRTLAEVRH